MILDVWHAIQLYWWVVIIGFIAAVLIERLHPLFKVLFWTATVSLFVYVFLRVVIGGIMNIVNDLVDHLSEVSK